MIPFGLDAGLTKLLSLEKGGVAYFRDFILGPESFKQLDEVEEG